MKKPPAPKVSCSTCEGPFHGLTACPPDSPAHKHMARAAEVTSRLQIALAEARQLYKVLLSEIPARYVGDIDALHDERKAVEQALDRLEMAK